MAVDSSADGDTVLVSPGRYHENIDTVGKAIVIGSLILTTGDPAYIDSTIIDGDSVDCCIAFVMQETRFTVLRGFTLTRGIQMFGGAIDIQTNARPTLQDLLITGNWASEIGAGIYCTWNSAPRIERVTIVGNSARQGGGFGSAHEAHPVVVNSVIRDNTATYEGGGVFCGHGSGKITMDRVIITGNRAGWGGAAYFEYSEGNILNNLTVTGNVADTVGGIYVAYASIVNLSNSIVYDNEMPEIALKHPGAPDSSVIEMRYNNLRFGRDSIRVEGNVRVLWGGGNIASDPCFTDAGEGDYHLAINSPCIDAGDPQAPEDADETRADMGVLPFLERGFLEGFVLDVENDSALAGAVGDRLLWRHHND